MPNLPNREQHERQIAAALLLLFDDFEEEALNGRFRAKSFQAQTRDRLRPLLANIHREASGQLAALTAYDLPNKKADGLAGKWSARYADRLSKQLAGTTAAAIDAAMKAETEEEARRRVRDIFGRRRAENIGITETTGTITRGESDAAKIIRDETGLKLIEIWRIEDEDACEICKPLEGTTRRIWGRRFPMGTPAHVRCRCDIEYGEPRGGGGYDIPRGPVDPQTFFTTTEIRIVQPSADRWYVVESWNESDHARDDNGRFVSTGAIKAAIGNPAKIKALQAKVTKPAELAKLNKSLGIKGKAAPAAKAPPAEAEAKPKKTKAKLKAAPDPAAVPKEVESAIKKVTPFVSWSDMKSAMEGGFVPVLKDETGPGSKAYNAQQKLVVEHAKAAGFKVIDGKKLAGDTVAKPVKPLSPAKLDDLTTDVTAFQSFEAMKTAMKGGYVPTLKHEDGNDAKTKKWNKKVDSLKEQVKLAGFKVFEPADPIKAEAFDNLPTLEDVDAATATADDGPVHSLKPAKVSKAVDAHTTKWVHSLDDDTVQAIRSYTGNDYADINGVLRTCGSLPKCWGDDDSGLGDKYRKIQAALEKSGPLPTEQTVYRGVMKGTAKQLVAYLEGKQASGGLFQANGLSSTSTDPEIALNFAEGGAIIKIKAKSGAFVKDISNFDSEEELLQKHGTKYRVVSIAKGAKVKQSNGGVIAMDVIELEEVLDNAPPAAPKKQAKPKAEKSGLVPRESKATVKTVGGSVKKIESHAAVQKYGGKLSGLASAIGAPDDAIVQVTYGNKNELYVKSTSGPAQFDELGKPVKTSEPRVEMERSISVNDKGETEIHNIFFKVSQTGTGLGTKLFADQVAAGIAAGAKRIHTDAARGGTDEATGKSVYNGYYTWPLMGYDGPIGFANFRDGVAGANEFDKKFPGVKTIQELYATAAGREWWKAKGNNINLSFDLTPGSKSIKVLEKYLASKQAKK